MSNTYLTGNPIGSTDPRDLYDNASNFDDGMNTASPSFTDRLGVLRKTWNGMETEFNLAQSGREAEFQQFLTDSGFVSLGNYAAGLNFTTYQQYMARDGFFYRPAPSSIPFTTTGTWVGGDENLFNLFSADDVLRQDLAAPTGTNEIGRGTGTLEDSLAETDGEIAAIQSEISASGYIGAITDEGRSIQPARMASRPRRVISKSLTSGVYDHFGVMDALPDGTPYLMFRRGLTHQDDIGKLLFVRQDNNGAWGTPVTIVDASGFSGPDAGMDIAGVAGGTAANGRLVCVGFKRFPLSVEPTYPNRDMVVYTSDDYGITWSLTSTITVTGGDNYKLPYGKLRVLDDGRLIVPYYTRDPANGFIAVRALESSDGGVSWVEGFTVVNSGTDYNETDFLPLGGGYILAVSRIGSGSGGKLRQFISANGGASWVDQGDVTSSITDSTNALVSPSLEYWTNEAGTDFVILLYTDRTVGQLYYRTIPVTSAITGSSGWSTKATLYSAPAESGYQSTVSVNGKILGNLFRSTTAGEVTGAYQFELRPGQLPDYDSDYFAVAASTTYTKAHGFGAFPSRVVVEWSPSIGGTAALISQSSVNVGGVPTPSGAVVTSDTSNIIAYTGTYTFSGTGFGFTGNQTAGFYRVRAWR